MDKTKQPALSPGEGEGVEPSVQRSTLVRNHILATLGRPPQLLRIDVAPLWKNTFRANILVGKSLDSAHFAHSYFVETTDAGEFVTSTPKLIRVYS